MATEQLVVTDKMERAIASGDLGGLDASERVIWYKLRCEIAGVDWRTNPFEYIKFEGKLTLYPKMEMANQLCRNQRISTIIVGKEILGDAILVTCRATDPLGVSADATGAVPIKGLQGKAYCNAIKVAESQSRRRAVFALSGLGGSDDEDMQAIGGERVQMAHSAPLAITSGNPPVQSQEGTGETKQTETANTHPQSAAGRQARIDCLKAWKANELPMAGDGCRVLENVLGFLPQKFGAAFEGLTDEQLQDVNHFITTGERPRHLETPTVKATHPEDTQNGATQGSEPSSPPPPVQTAQGEEVAEESNWCPKVAYSTPLLAIAAMGRLREKPEYVCPPGKTLNWYVCEECTLLGRLGEDTVHHIGHTANPAPTGIPDPNGPLMASQRQSILDICEATIPPFRRTWTQ